MHHRRGPDAGAEIGRAGGQVAEVVAEGEVERAGQPVVEPVHGRVRLAQAQAHGVEPRIRVVFLEQTQPGDAGGLRGLAESRDPAGVAAGLFEAASFSVNQMPRAQSEGPRFRPSATNANGEEEMGPGTMSLTIRGGCPVAGS